MSPPDRYSGVFAPVVTPFDDDLSPDVSRLLAHCRWLLSHDVGLAVFGTNSEGNSLSVPEKAALLDRLVEAGIDPGRLMPGTGCSALTDTVTLTRHAVDAGCGGVLMLPPFYYKNVSDEGLFRSYAEVIERTGSASLRVYLYHIPPVSQVGLSVALVERLVEAYPGVIAGIKDSSGDWDNTAALLARGWPGFRVFAGSETFLLRTVSAGGAGCISAAANVNPGAIARLCRGWKDAGAEEAQQRLDEVRAVLQKRPMIAALKAVIAHFREDAGWAAVRPPLVPLAEGERQRLVADLLALGFDMQGSSESGGTPGR